jgi:hypothetical protein
VIDNVTDQLANLTIDTSEKKQLEESPKQEEKTEEKTEEKKEDK